MSVEDNLREWGLEQYIPVFQAQGIDQEVLLDLNSDLASQVVPLLGHRIKLLRGIDKLKAASRSVAEPSSPRGSRRSRSPSPPSTPPLGSIQGNHTPTHSEQEEEEDDPRQIVSTEATEATEATWGQLLKVRAPNKVVKALLNRKSDTLRLLSNYPASKKKFKVKKGLKRAKNYCGFDIKHQRLLCDILVKEYCKDPNSIGCVTSVVDQLSDDIIATFPKERKSQYYVPFKCFRVERKVVKRFSARGRLYHKFVNYVKILRDEHVICGSSSSTLDSSERVISSDVDASLQWLQKRVEICPRLREEWMLTHDARINTLRTRIDARGENYLDKYIRNLYPFLGQPDGYCLLLTDFDRLYPDKKNCLFMEWMSFSTNIKRLANKLDEDLTDTEVLYLLGDLFEAEGLVSVPVSRKFRAGKKEMLRSFLLHVETVDDITVEIEAYETRAHQEKTTVQPYAIAVGPWPNPAQFYVSYGDVLVRVDSVKDSIDITFKIFHALHAQYPKTCQSYWLLIQKVIYKLDSPWDVVLPEVESLRSKLIV